MRNDRTGAKIIAGVGRTRQIVRKRDNYTCQDCKAIRIPEEAVKLNKRLFDVHHLNGLCGKMSRKYDKVGTIGGLITLCHKCHFNRPEHNHKGRPRIVDEKRYKDIVKMRANRFTLREIGEKYGVSRERIRQILLKP